jgi:hypothetical protein
MGIFGVTEKFLKINYKQSAVLPSPISPIKKSK